MALKPTLRDSLEKLLHDMGSTTENISPSFLLRPKVPACAGGGLEKAEDGLAD